MEHRARLALRIEIGAHPDHRPHATRQTGLGNQIGGKPAFRDLHHDRLVRPRRARLCNAGHDVAQRRCHHHPVHSGKRAVIQLVFPGC